MSSTDVAVIGAGPYGLSIAAQLARAKVDHRVFGQPMELWLNHMPKGMLLKSEGFASSLYAGDDRYSLRNYCRERGLAYQDIGLPISLSTFCEYALAFQRRLVPHLEPHHVTELTQTDSGFSLALATGERMAARRVVVAIGVRAFRYIPSALAALPADLASHSSDHAEPSVLAGKEIVVLGGGASAVDIAALLHEAGARVRLVSRGPKLEIHSRMRLPRPLIDRLREPMSGIGPSWRSWFFTNAPQIYHGLPLERRLKWVRTHLGPAGGWFMAERVRGKFPILLDRALQGARAEGGQIQVQFWHAREKKSETLTADHVICATGFRPDLTRLMFLAPSLYSSIATVERTPVLSSRFESNVPGLFFTGPIAANSFGPVMRFAVGADFAASRIANTLARSSAGRGTAKEPSPAAGMRLSGSKASAGS